MPKKPQQDEEPRGYHKLAQQTMGPYPQLAIFRKFASLDMLNLLSLQAELTHLESQLKAISKRDDRSGDTASAFSIDFRQMLIEMAKAEESNSVPPKQWLLIVRIREKLHEYNSTLLQVSQVTTLPKPYKQHLALLRDSLNETDSGSSFLKGSEFFTWEKMNEGDLISVNVSTEEDEFTHWFNTHPLKWYHWLIGSQLSESKKGPVAAYSDSRIGRIATVVTSVVSALLPVVAVLILFYVKATHDRIYIMLGLTALFAFAIATFTSAKHHEIFAATAAFAAVEVVFIGSVDDSRNAITVVLPTASGQVTTILSSLASTATSLASTVVTATSTRNASPTSTPNAANASHRDPNLATIIGVSVSIPLAVVAFVCACYLVVRRKQQAFSASNLRPRAIEHSVVASHNVSRLPEAVDRFPERSIEEARTEKSRPQELPGT